MNSVEFDIVKNLIENKKYDVITEFAHIEHPSRGEIVVNEYVGEGVRVYKDLKGRTRVLCPKDMSVIEEGHVAEAIARGTIFDDADEVDNNAKFIEKTSIPYDAMVNSGKDTPKKLRPMIAIVIGKMDDSGSFSVDDADRINGNSFVKDLITAPQKNSDVLDVVNNYIDNTDNKNLGSEMGKDVTDLDKEVDDIRDTKTEDVISDDDCLDDDEEFKMYDEEENDDNDNDEDYDEDDEDEDDDELTEEFLATLYDDVEVFQEGVVSMVKTLKKLNYDPKTKTILTDIPIPGATKKGDNVRVKVKMADEISLQSGTCITWEGRTKDGAPDKDTAVIHISPSDLLFSSEAALTEAIKHEEGHLAVRYDPERFKKDFIRAGKIVDKNREKLGNNYHDLSREEYVADLYSAKQSGFKGKGTIEKFNKVKKNYIKTSNDTRKSIEKQINLAKKLRHKLYHDTNTSPAEKRKLMESIRKSHKNIDGFFQKIINLYDSILKTTELINQGLDVLAEKKGANYAADEADVSRMFEKQRVATLSVKDKVKALGLVLADNLPEEKYVSYVKNLIKNNKETEQIQDALIHGLTLRIAHIKRFVNENGDIDSTEKYGDDYDNNDIVEEGTDARPSDNRCIPTASDDPNVPQSGLVAQSSNVKQEAFFSRKPKKLKPIPRDIVAYITCEMNDIKSANDQAMLSGYTCSKLELVDFYLTVLDTQDPRYLVPHNKQYLENMKRELENLLTQILRIRPINRMDRVWRVNVNYPEGRI